MSLWCSGFMIPDCKNAETKYPEKMEKNERKNGEEIIFE